MPERPWGGGAGSAETPGVERQADEARGEQAGAEAQMLMEEVVRRENLKAAHRRVVRNGGAPGIDGMTVEELMPYCREHWARIREELLGGTYEPKPVRLVEIAKPDGGGVRTLGIPTVLDRMIQQALLQKLTPIFDPTFSEASYGFRPGRSAQGAVLRAREHIAAGNRWVVDLDLERFFDRVNHDVLMARVARRVKDKRVLRLIRRYLQAGMMAGGLATPRTEGTPQGGPLSPLLSNILLDELDKELEQRGHRFVRYADDCNVYVGSEAAGKRVMASAKLRPICRRGRGRDLAGTITELGPVLRGWVAYFRMAEAKRSFEELDGWVRRRLRCVMWRQWKTARTRLRELQRLGVRADLAAAGAYGGPGARGEAERHHMKVAVPNEALWRLGLVSLLEEHQRLARIT